MPRVSREVQRQVDEARIEPLQCATYISRHGDIGKTETFCFAVRKKYLVGAALGSFCFNFRVTMFRMAFKRL